ncbi:uncharacterized protein BDZ99DRAFT_523261 [Mytilinidion resinicola]|uniref:Uncharacterized protein n=1 Tax=Mytilinidion resinicola TaxID=574789 RepID=A0A6A6YDS9_9PEZI|nr:uncharacterized protein BDZ99DRAFT_523261 [Mytilinidion resinicola]KAF2806683.1 hypothetical protein BDZ99DRAFT_523261 [Mytilinidion resinicola]
MARCERFCAVEKRRSSSTGGWTARRALWDGPRHCDLQFSSAIGRAANEGDGRAPHGRRAGCFGHGAHPSRRFAQRLGWRGRRRRVEALAGSLATAVPTSPAVRRRTSAQWHCANGMLQLAFSIEPPAGNEGARARFDLFTASAEVSHSIYGLPIARCRLFRLASLLRILRRADETKPAVPASGQRVPNVQRECRQAEHAESRALQTELPAVVMGASWMRCRLLGFFSLAKSSRDAALR